MIFARGHNLSEVANSVTITIRVVEHVVNALEIFNKACSEQSKHLKQPAKREHEVSKSEKKHFEFVKFLYQEVVSVSMSRELIFRKASKYLKIITQTY